MAKSRYHRLGIGVALVVTMAKGCASKQRLKDSQRLEKSFETPCRVPWVDAGSVSRAMG
jgi:hypothetical protein